MQSPGQGSCRQAALVGDAVDLLFSAIQALSHSVLSLNLPEVPCNAACGCTTL